MAAQKRLVQLRLNPDLYAHIQEAARLDRRPMTQWIVVACDEKLSRPVESHILPGHIAKTIGDDYQKIYDEKSAEFRQSDERDKSKP